MKTALRFFTICIFFVTSSIYAELKVTKLSEDGTKVMLQSTGERFQQGQRFYFIYKGRKVGEGQVLKVSPKGRQAITQIVGGKAAVGLIAVDKIEWNRSKSASKSNRQHEIESNHLEQTSARDNQDHLGFVGVNVGYDLELAEEFVDGGLNFGAQAVYKFTPNFGLGGRFSRTSGKISVKDVPLVADFEVDAVAMSFIADGLYFFSPNAFIGPSLGYTMLDCDGCDGNNGFMFGATAGYDIMLSSNFGLGARLGWNYVMIKEEEVFDKLMFVNANLSASYWF